MAALSWTRTRVASSSSGRLGVTERADLPDDLAARVAQRTMEEFGEPWRETARQRTEPLQYGDDGGELRTLRAILHLDGDADALVHDGDAVHTFGADLGDA